MRRYDYVPKVLGCLTRLTPQERMAVRQELDAHIEDHMEALLELGYEPELAEQRTMERMGDPEEVGRALNAQYPLFWLVLERILQTLLCVSVILFLWNMLTMYSLQESLGIRRDPYAYATEKQLLEIDTRLDIRLEIGSDVLHIFGSGTDEECQAHVFYCWYAQRPLGYVTEREVELVDCRGVVLPRSSGGWSSSGRVASYDTRGPVQVGDPYVTAVTERYGERYEVQIPLEWEVQS